MEVRQSSFARAPIWIVVLATVYVLALPPSLVLGLERLFDLSPSIPQLAALILGTAIAVSFVGAGLWSRLPQASLIQFDELMLWSYVRLKRAERRLIEDVQRLGLDRLADDAKVDLLSPAAQMNLLKDLMNALEAKDLYTRGHTARVERHAYNVAMALGLTVKEVEDIRRAAAIHDVGKVRIPDYILRKPGKLTPEERALMEEHPATGAEMAAGLQSAEITAAIRHHHERWDGNGYPDGLSRNDIPLGARVIAVADTYDAITSSRSYRPSATREQAIAIIRSEKGKQFDEHIVDVFIERLNSRGVVAAALLVALPALFKRVSERMGHLAPGGLSPFAAALGGSLLLTILPPVDGSVPESSRPRIAHGATTDASEWRAAESLLSATTSNQVLGVRVRRTSAAARPKNTSKRAAGKERRRRDKSTDRSISTGSGSHAEDVERIASASEPEQDVADPGAEVLDLVPVEGDPRTAGNDCSRAEVSLGGKLHCRK